MDEPHKVSDPDITVTVPLTIKQKQIVDFLNEAFDPYAFSQRIGYWAEIEPDYGPYKDKATFLSRIGCEESLLYSTLPLIDGCATIIVEVVDDEDESQNVKYRLDREAIIRGLTLLAEKCPKNFANFMEENHDVVDADNFVQLAVLGELRYG